MVEEFPFIDPYRRVTKRFTQFVLTLCKHMSIKGVAECIDMDLIASFNRVIDRVRNIEYRKADEVGRQVIKGSKYLLLKNKEKITQREAPGLKALLELNTSIYINVYY